MILFNFTRQVCGQSHPREVETRENDLMRYTVGLLDRSRQELDRADAKATTLLAGLGVGVGAVLAGIFAGAWSPRDLLIFGAIGWWIGSATALVGVFQLLYAVYPRTTPPVECRPVPAAYYGDIVDASDKKMDIPDQIRQAGAREFDALADQVLQISLIVRMKYNGIRRGIWLVSTGVAIAAGSVIADSIFDIYGA